MMKPDLMEDVLIIGGLVAVQFVYAGNLVLFGYLMALGLNPLTIVVMVTQLLLPSSFFSHSLFILKVMQKPMAQQMQLVTLFQSLLLKGIKLTSPAMATTMPNLAPGLIFVIAWTLGLEKIKIRCMYNKVKIVGTLLFVAGAITMSIMHSTATVIPEARDIKSSHNHDLIFDKQKIIGCVYLMAAVFVLSSNVVLQGGAVSGACVSFNGWAMKKRGPVLVSMFSPIGAVISFVLSVITLGDTINLGSLAGMCLMFTGLYFVIWAKGKEGFSSSGTEILESEFDAEKPLLS